MVMINIIKIELINTAENCWLSIFSVRIVFYQLNYFLSIPFLFGQDQGGRGGGGGGGGAVLPRGKKVPLQPLATFLVMVSQ